MSEWSFRGSALPELHMSTRRCKAPRPRLGRALATLLLATPLLVWLASGPASATSVLGTPIRALYVEVTHINPPVLDPLSDFRVETGPTVYLSWRNPAKLPAPPRVALLRGPSGGPLHEIWSCEDDVDGCPMLSYRDSDGLVPRERYDYQVVISNHAVEAASEIQSLQVPLVVPRGLTAVLDLSGALELRWQPTTGAALYEVRRSDLPEGETTVFFVDGSVTKLIDDGFAGAARYEIQACELESQSGQCDGFRTNTARLGVGGERFVHGLFERVSRHRFRPDAALARDPGNPWWPSERLIFRDEVTGAPVARMTSDPHKDYHLYSNIPVWNADGSRLVYHTDHGPHWGWRVMEADGSKIRDVAIDGLGEAASPGQQLWSDTAHFGLRWDGVDPDLLYYYDREGAVGRLRPASDAGPQTPLGVLFTAPEVPEDSFWLELHPDGTRGIAVDSIQQRGFGPPSTVFVLDLETDMLVAPPLALEDDEGTPVSADNLWFTGAADHRFSFNVHGISKQYGVSPPFSSPIQLDVQDEEAFRRVAFDPDGSHAVHSRNDGFVVTELATGIGVQIADGLIGHKSWGPDPEWFAATGGTASLWRIWIDGHATLLATPYTFLVYEGEHHTAFLPELSPDGTKLAFTSPMLGDDDLYTTVVKLPDPPGDPSLDGTTLRWDAPARSREIAHYNVWESSTSGLDATLLASVPAPAGEAEVGAPGDRFFRVTAVEHSGLEGLPSAEVTAAAAPEQRIWLEPHLAYHPAALGQKGSLGPIFDGDATGLYVVEAIGDSPDPADAFAIPTPTGEFRLFALTRGTAGEAFTVYDGDTAIGQLGAETGDFAWTELDAGIPVVLATGALTLVPTAVGIAVDQLLLTSDPDFVPTGRERRLHTALPAPPAVSDLAATPGDFQCSLSWSDPGVTNFSHYQVYASRDPAEDTWDQARGVATVTEPEVVDWGLAPATAYQYRVSAVDRHDREGALAAAQCTTNPLVPYHLEIFPDEPTGILPPDPVTGVWRFAYDVPAEASPAEFVAWLRVHSIRGWFVEDDLLRTVAGETALFDLAPRFYYATVNDTTAPEQNQELWVHLSLATDALHELRSAPLEPGPGEVEIAPAAGRPLADLRISGFVLTNDLSFVPEGLSDYLFPDTRSPLAVVPQSGPCDDGLDNDGDDAFDYPSDPGCASPDDPTEDDPLLACDNGVDDDGDGQIDTADPGCSDPGDGSEQSPELYCDDGLDNDGDGQIDTADPECVSSAFPHEEIPACDNGVDDDGDGFTDTDDPGCDDFRDTSERRADLRCDDGVDNDDDGQIDQDDPSCESPSFPWEDVPECQDGIDNDGDGQIDFQGLDLNFDRDFVDPGEGPRDSGCWSFVDRSEEPDCSDGRDNDGDGRTDFPADEGCRDASSVREAPACSDGIDNDGDGQIDWNGGPGGEPMDLACMLAPYRTKETSASCGFGFELVLALPLLARLRRRLRGAPPGSRSVSREPGRPTPRPSRVGSA